MFLDSYNAVILATKNMYQNYLVVALLFIFLITASIIDIKSMKIPDKLNGLFLVIRLACIPIIGFSHWNVLGGIIGLLVLLIPAMIKMHKMGGDIKCMGVIGFYLGAYVIPLFVALSCVVGLVIGFTKVLITKKKDNIPFAPSFLVAHTILFIVCSVSLI